jgi:hypothetical protein
MSSFVKEFVKIDDRTTLDDAIDVLMELRRALPEGANAELRMRGDDIFGRHLSLCYMRPKAVDERATELPYRLAARGMS